MLAELSFDCIFASLVLFVFHNWAHPIDRPVLGGFFNGDVFLFVRTKIADKRLAKQLAGFVATSDAIRRNLNQESWAKVLRGFKKGYINMLVANDIAARCIDVKNLDYIVHSRLPKNA